MIDLSAIVNNYPRSATSRAQLASLLRDLYPEEKRSVNIALMVYDSGILSRMVGLQGINSVQYHTFVKQLVDDFGLQETCAVSGIEMWARAYKIPIEKNIAATETQQRTKPQSIVHNPDAYAKSGEVVNGLASDYETTSVNTTDIIISKFRGFGEANIIVPNVIDGRRVIGIGKDAYQSCTEVTSLVISDGIEFIDDAAFADCKNLKKVILPETLKRIGSVEQPNNNRYVSFLNKPRFTGAFENCGIKSITLPVNLSYLGKSSFSWCTELCSIDLPNTITAIMESSFGGCTSLVKVVLSENLRTIGTHAFSSCSKLSDIQYPTSLQEIGDYAFNGCDSLNTVVLNEGLKKIGQAAFGNCSNLSKFLMPSTVTEIKENSYSRDDLFTITGWYQPSDRRRNGWSTTSKNERVTVYCYSGSYGLEYARAKGYPIQNATNFSK